jgi:zona occludens toxin (predicted ATPase)
MPAKGEVSRQASLLFATSPNAFARYSASFSKVPSLPCSSDQEEHSSSKNLRSSAVSPNGSARSTTVVVSARSVNVTVFPISNGQISIEGARAMLETLTQPYGSAGTTAEHPHPLIAQLLPSRDEAQRPPDSS